MLTRRCDVAIVLGFAWKASTCPTSPRHCGHHSGMPPTIRYDEGAEVDYRWFARQDETPLYAFGHGFSYKTCVYSDLKVCGRRDHDGEHSVTVGHRWGGDPQGLPNVAYLCHDVVSTCHDSR